MVLFSSPTTYDINIFYEDYILLPHHMPQDVELTLLSHRIVDPVSTVKIVMAASIERYPCAGSGRADLHRHICELH